ncbi:MAG TPA: SPOR domain-containing protein [Gemmatimonadaceae bacterium]|nr:SPOR domain-containing protein [Gemmatimonadaceae bacterium]
MTATTMRAPPGAYEGAGRQVAVAVRGCSAVAVVSEDIISAAHVAIGIGLAESGHRLVMLADLAGEVAPLQSLVTDDDPHGVYDGFTFGTSFGKIAREVDGASNLFVMPSGTESAAIEEIIGNPRWKHFATEFAEADELLIVVVKPDAPGVGKLAGYVDGLVFVGPGRLDAAPDARILARVPHPVIPPPPKIDLTPKPEPWTPARMGMVAAGLLTLGIAAGAFFGSRGDDSATEQPAIDPAVRADSIAADSAQRARRAQILPSNPQDSSTALAYSIVVSSFNTLEGANFELDRHRAALPAATISLVPIGDTEATWYKVMTGAYGDIVDAERLLRTLRRRRIVSDSGGLIIRAPLALLVDSLPPQGGAAARAREKVQDYATRGVAVYALMQTDGAARFYAGAFENPDQSSLAATALRVAGVTPVLAYRTGRIP